MQRRENVGVFVTVCVNLLNIHNSSSVLIFIDAYDKMTSVINVHFPPTNIRTLLFQPYTLDNLANMTSAVLNISVAEATSSYRPVYKENGNEVHISSDTELSGYILKSMPTSDIFIVKIHNELTQIA